LGAPYDEAAEEEAASEAPSPGPLPFRFARSRGRGDAARDGLDVRGGDAGATADAPLTRRPLEKEEEAGRFSSDEDEYDGLTDDADDGVVVAGREPCCCCCCCCCFRSAVVDCKTTRDARDDDDGDDDEATAGSAREGEEGRKARHDKHLREPRRRGCSSSANRKCRRIRSEQPPCLEGIVGISFVVDRFLPVGNLRFRFRAEASFRVLSDSLKHGHGAADPQLSKTTSGGVLPESTSSRCTAATGSN
jgi:hypothetical protein